MNAPHKPLVARFAPSPTGRMHAGNIFASLMTWLLAKASGGRVVLRIEDLDKARSKPEYATQIMRDYEMLGLAWDDGPYYQHDRDEAYQQAFDLLTQQNLVYPCFCTRADLHAQSAPHAGETFVYARTCRHLSDGERAAKTAALATQKRMPSQRLMVPDQDLCFEDLIQGPYSENLERDCGDFVVKRADGSFAYQLAVVVDDCAQGVILVSRGVDLLTSTPQQIYLQRLLGFPTPFYAHLPLLIDETGRRLSKRNQDASLDHLLATCGSPEAIIGTLAALVGLIDSAEPITPQKLLDALPFEAIVEKLKGPQAITWEPSLNC